jgi:hypothetical protein
MYSKPEVAVLEGASAVIELINRHKITTPAEGASDPTHCTPAYDLDE